MYGTRPADEGWHSECASTMVDLGFTVGESTACVSFRPELWIASSVHGDDFATIGPKSSPDIFVNNLKERYELKEAARLGASKEDDKEGRVLNRVIR